MSTPDRAGTREDWDALVVGGGPAGATAARELARRGARVLLVDRARFPRAKTCGSCLAPAALESLRATGLGELAARAGAVPLRALHLRHGARSVELPLAGAVLSRERLDAELLDAARRAGVVVREGVRAVDPLADAPAGLVRLEEERDAPHADREDSLAWPATPARFGCTVRARAVVVATGLAGARTQARAVPGARLGAGFVGEVPADDLPPGVVDMVVGAAGYVGRARLEDGRVDVACALDPAAVRAAGGPGPAAAALLAGADRPGAPELARARWRGTPLLTRRVDPAPAGAFLVGDAAGYVEPFTGEGIAWALAGGAAVAEVAAAARDGWTPALADAWRRAHARTVAARFGPARVLAALLRRPRLTAAGVALAAALPATGAAVARRVQRLPAPRTRSRSAGTANATATLRRAHAREKSRRAHARESREREVRA